MAHATLEMNHALAVDTAKLSQRTSWRHQVKKVTCAKVGHALCTTHASNGTCSANAMLRLRCFRVCNGTTAVPNCGKLVFFGTFPRFVDQTKNLQWKHKQFAVQVKRDATCAQTTTRRDAASLLPCDVQIISLLSLSLSLSLSVFFFQSFSLSPSLSACLSQFSLTLSCVSLCVCVCVCCES